MRWLGLPLVSMVSPGQGAKASGDLGIRETPLWHEVFARRRGPRCGHIFVLFVLLLDILGLAQANSSFKVCNFQTLLQFSNHFYAFLTVHMISRILHTPCAAWRAGLQESSLDLICKRRGTGGQHLCFCSSSCLNVSGNWGVKGSQTVGGVVGRQGVWWGGNRNLLPPPFP